MRLPIDTSMRDELLRPSNLGAAFTVMSEDILRYDSDQQTWSSLMRNPGQALGVEASPDQKQLACLDHDATVKIVSVLEKRVVNEWKVGGLSGAGAACWHDGTGNLLITGTQGKVATIVCIDPETGEELWSVPEPSHDRMVRVVATGETTFLHSGTPFKQRDARTGELIQVLDWTEQCSIDHQVLARAKDSRRIQSWSRYTLDYSSNASEPVICWDAETLEPELVIIAVGNHDWATLTPAGQIIDATDEATDHLVWIAQQGSETKLLTYESFHDSP
jgi:WD40 repeat protein